MWCERCEACPVHMVVQVGEERVELCAGCLAEWDLFVAGLRVALRIGAAGIRLPSGRTHRPRVGSWGRR